MDFAAAHAGFVIAAYGLSLVVLGGLSAHILLRDRRLRAAARRLDCERGDTRA